MLKNKTFVKIVSFVLLIAFLAVSLLSALPLLRASATTAEEKITQSQKKQQEIRQQINESKKEKEISVAAKEIIDREVAELQAGIDIIVADIAVSNSKINQKEEELKAAEEEHAAQYESYCNRAEILLERGSVSYLEILIKADSFEDFLTRAALVQEIAEHDTNKLKEIEKQMEEIEKLKAELVEENDKLLGLKADEDKKMAVLRQKQSESQAIIDSIQSDIAKYEKALAAQEKAEAAARAEIARLQAPASVSSTYTGGKFTWPSVSTYITSSYGTRTHPVTGKVKTHTGIDIGAAHGTNIYAATDGKVIVSGWNAGGYGNYVVIDHGGGVTTLYAHCSSLAVSSGQTVTKGQVIAKCGSTGMSTGPHLHFEVLINGGHTNPMSYFN